jgi:hypothetical protein
MNETEKREKIGWNRIAPGNVGTIFDHQWDRDDELVTIGELSAAQVADLTDGLMHEAVRYELMLCSHPENTTPFSFLAPPCRMRSQALPAARNISFPASPVPS